MFYHSSKSFLFYGVLGFVALSFLVRDRAGLVVFTSRVSSGIFGYHSYSHSCRMSLLLLSSLQNGNKALVVAAGDTEVTLETCLIAAEKAFDSANSALVLRSCLEFGHSSKEVQDCLDDYDTNHQKIHKEWVASITECYKTSYWSDVLKNESPKPPGAFGFTDLGVFGGILVFYLAFHPTIDATVHSAFPSTKSSVLFGVFGMLALAILVRCFCFRPYLWIPELCTHAIFSLLLSCIQESAFFQVIGGFILYLFVLKPIAVAAAEATN